MPKNIFKDPRGTNSDIVNRKIKKLERNAVVNVLSEFPIDKEGREGDMYLINKGEHSHLLYKSNNAWHKIAGDRVHASSIIGSSSMSPGDNDSPLGSNGYDHDSGWINMNNGNDSSVIGTTNNPKGVYRLNHRMGANLFKSEVFCRFEATYNGEIKTYTVNLNSSNSSPGPNANRCGYWIESVDSNNADLHISPDGLSILYSERFKDTSDNTSVLLSSNDTDNIALMEVRVFLYPIVNKKGKKPSLNYSRVGKNPLANKRKNKKVTGKSVVGNLGATVDGTKNSSFAIDSDGTGVLLKNDDGTLSFRNADDTAHVEIQAKQLKLPVDIAGVSDIEKGVMHYDSDFSAFRMHARYLLLDNFITGTEGEDAVILIQSKKNDSVLKFQDESTPKWSIGYDGYNTTTFTQANCVLNEGNTTVTFPDGENLDTKGSTGLSVSGHVDIPANTYIASFNYITNSLTLTNAPTGSGTVTLTFNTVENKFKINPGNALADSSLFSLDTTGQLTLTSTTADQFKVSYDESNYGLINVADDGHVEIESVGTDADMTLKADGEIKLETSSKISLETADGEANAVSITTEDSDEIAFSFDMEHENNTQFTMNEQGGKSTDDYFRISVGEEADTIISTLDASGTDADLTLDIDGDITLDSATGAFIAKKAGTQFSVANSAYAGMILGYRCLGHNAGRVSYTITTGFVTLHANATVRFIAPPSGVVEVYVQAGYLDAVASRFIYFGLSDNATYNTIGAEHEEVVNLTDESDQRVIQNKWVISGLTAGNTYNYWFGIKSSHPSSVLNYGGTGSGHYPPFIMSVTALPTAVSDFAEYA